MPEEKDKKLEYLQREEVKTMQKDIAALREMEASQERKKVSKINTEEETQKQKEKEEAAKKAANQRVLEQLRAQEKEEEIKRLREERVKREAEPARQEIEGHETRTEGFKDALREVQVKEEEERKKFLQRVEAKMEGLPAGKQDKEELPQPKPPVEPQSVSEKIKPLAVLKKIPKPVFKKPSFVQKLWIRIVLTLLTIAIIAAVATFWYWYLAVREKTVAPPLIKEETVLPKPEKPIVIEAPLVTERILSWGYYIPATPRSIDTILIHSIYNVFSEDPYSVEGIIQEYQYYGVAAHYLIDRDGTINRSVPDEYIAYHAGTSQMLDGRKNVNNFSIGIELIQTKTESPNAAQYLVLAQLIKYLQQEYNIPSENILGHKDVSPDRKTDPWNFDWEKFTQLIQ